MSAGANSVSWSFATVAIIVGVAVAMSAAGTLVISRTLRGRARVFYTKIFFRYKYDYRKEWLRFIGILSQAGLDHVPRTAVRAVAPIVNSPGGIVWIQEEEGDDYMPVGAWRCELPVGRSIPRAASLVKFLQKREWVIDLNEFKSYAHRYGELELDEWLADRHDIWLIVPLMIGNQLLGLITLLKPKTVPRLNFEDHDLLKTVGRHVATHIKQAELDKRLAESSQFGTYHRLSAFLMHDLNNLIAQQSLVVKNAEKFRHDPRFVDDTVETIANSVARMRRLMDQLSRNSREPASEVVRLREIVQQAVERCKPRRPVPIVNLKNGEACLEADRERLTVVIEHLIRNAQDATEQNGTVEILANAHNDMAVIQISDTGCGMSAEFISERLFRPFDSTKGSENMGIGAYQAREYARMLRGYLEVESREKQGTTFTMRLPLSRRGDLSEKMG